MGLRKSTTPFSCRVERSGDVCEHQGAHKGIFKLARRLALQGNMSVQFTPHVKAVRDLYRRSLRLALDWAVQRNLWRGQAVYIRSLFDANRNVNDPRRQRVLFLETNTNATSPRQTC